MRRPSPLAHRLGLLSLTFALSFCAQTPAQTQQPPPAPSDHIAIWRYEITIPMQAAGPKGLKSYLFVPSTPGRHPLVLITHGTGYGKTGNSVIGPGDMQPEALWFAHRGWAVAIVIRRGYGDSGGTMDNDHTGCSPADFDRIARHDASDLQAAYDALAPRPDIDITRVIATGASTGGFAAVAFGAYAPTGLKTVINFSGGWRSTYSVESCIKSSLAPEFRILGSTTHVPTLWLYADNDSLFGPKYVAQVYAAFTSSGGKATLSTFPRSGADGHGLFSESHNLWGPVVEKYLTSLDLPATPIIPDTPPPSIKLPNGFSQDAQDAFQKFQALGPHKSFAVGPNGTWGYSTGERSPKSADDDALTRCGNPACKVIARDPQ